MHILALGFPAWTFSTFLKKAAVGVFEKFQTVGSADSEAHTFCALGLSSSDIKVIQSLEICVLLYTLHKRSHFSNVNINTLCKRYNY